MKQNTDGKRSEREEKREELIQETIDQGTEIIDKSTEIMEKCDGMIQKQRKKGWKGLVSRRFMYMGALLSALLTVVLCFSGVLESADKAVSDMIFQVLNRKYSTSMIKIIAIDDTTVEHYGEYEDWSRSKTAALLLALNDNVANAPRVIGIDLDYSESKEDYGDQELATVCSWYDNICLGVSVTDSREKADGGSKKKKEDTASSDGIEESDVKMPYEALAGNVTVGINRLLESEDGYVRSAIVDMAVENTRMDSFAVAVYKMYRDSRGMGYALPKSNDEQAFTFTYNSQGEDYSRYSFYDVVSGNVDSSVFENCIVMVGDYTDKDSVVKAPNQDASHMHEIEMQANILEALMLQRTGQPVSKAFMAAFFGIFIGLCFIVTSYSSGFRTMLAALFLQALQLAACVFMNRFGYYITILIPMILMVAVGLINLLLRYLILLYSRQAVESVLEKYLDKSVVDELGRDGLMEAHIGVVRKDIAVLFVDIRGFTSLSECLMPEQIVEILNRYLALVSEAVSKYQGTLDKFIGDAAMAVFNSPFDLEDYEFCAVCAAWDLLSKAQELNRMCKEEYGKQVTFGIGIQCGEAVIGNIGCESRMDYTAIGDTVNTASRLEGAAAPGQILISGEMKERLGDRVATSFAGEFALKGKQKKVPTYILEGID